MDVLISESTVTKYDKKLYRDDFGKEKNPFKFVSNSKATFNDRTIIVVNKFIKHPSRQDMHRAVLKTLKDTFPINYFKEVSHI